MQISKKKLRILDLDIENRPLSYWGENPTSEITAIASCWTDDIGSLEVSLLGRDDPVEMLLAFARRYAEADVVTAHNIRGHDLPTINGALIEYGLPQLGPKMAVDTYLDMKKRKGIPASQEYLLDLFNLSKKVHMGQDDWRESNRLLGSGLSKTERRCTQDVLDHMRLRPEMVKRGLLNSPKIWHP